MRRAAIGLIRVYQRALSPLLGPRCKYHPSCSEYAVQAIDGYGILRGSVLAAWRLLRCNPFGTSGIDNVPLTAPQSARWYLPWRYGRWRGVNAS